MDLRDPFSSASHLVTAVWAVYATLILLRLTRGGRDRKAAVAVYGLSMVVLYLASGTFHALYYDSPEQRRFFQRIDQSAVFLLIAGTNTPMLVMLLCGWWRRWFLRLMWGLAAVAIGCLWLLPKTPHEVLVCLCLGMGWLGALPLAHYYRAVGRRAMTWVWVGALAYTLGALCELAQWPVIATWPVRVGFHEVFHLCDTAGSMSFFLFVCRYVIAYEKPAAEPAPDDEPELTATATALQALERNAAT